MHNDLNKAIFVCSKFILNICKLYIRETNSQCLFIFKLFIYRDWVVSLIGPGFKPLSATTYMSIPGVLYAAMRNKLIQWFTLNCTFKNYQ